MKDGKAPYSRGRHIKVETYKGIATRVPADDFDAYGDVGFRVTDFLNDSHEPPEWFTNAAELPARVREVVDAAPAAMVVETGHWLLNPDLWTEEYERELMVGMHGGSARLSDIIVQEITTPSAIRDWNMLQSLFERRDRCRLDSAARERRKAMLRERARRKA